MPPSLTWLTAMLKPKWFGAIRQTTLKSDIIAGFLMGVLVIPQSLGYAMLAGLPPVMGLYASILPTLIYAYFGASYVQAVGPVAVTAIMTTGSLAAFEGYENYPMLATTLAMMVGGFLGIAYLLRLGWITQFISRGVSAGFISAAAVLIVAGQIKGLVGLPLVGSSLSQMIIELSNTTTDRWIDTSTAYIGLICLSLLLISRYAPHYVWGWLPKNLAVLASRLFVILIVILAGVWVAYFDISTHTLGALPTQPPSLNLHLPSLEIITTLLPKALLIALIVFVSTATVSDKLAKTTATPYHSNTELLGLSLANIASGLSGGFAVAGGLSRTSLNVAAGAKTPLASVVCALVVLLILLSLGRLLAGLPYAVLSAVIISSVLAMIDLKTLKDAYHHDKADMLAFLASFFGVCLFGLNIGLVMGLFVSFACLIYRSHQVHIAVVGQVEGSEHFRNIHRHTVNTFEQLLLIRIDESLYFGNATLVYQHILKLIKQYPKACHVVLIMTAVNHVDLSAQTMLVELNDEIKKQHKQLHYSDIKGPIMDTLRHTNVLIQLSGRIFLSTMQAVNTLNPPNSSER